MPRRYFAQMNRNMQSPYFANGSLRPSAKREFEVEDKIERFFKKIFLFWKKN